MIFHSDLPTGQDRWIMQRVFANRTTPGYFIDAGAADGVGASNTCALERTAGWTGLLCEPNASFFEHLKANRSSICLQVALSDADGEAEFVNAAYHGKLASVAEKFALPGQAVTEHPVFRGDAYGQAVSVSTVPVRRLDTLLDEHDAPVVIDYLSIDIEGHELEALQSFPFDRRVILAMTVENYYTTTEPRTPAHHRPAVNEFLRAKGYQLVRTEGADDFFLHPSIVRADLIEV